MTNSSLASLIEILKMCVLSYSTIIETIVVGEGKCSTQKYSTQLRIREPDR